MKRKSEAHFHAEKKPNGCSPKRLLQRKKDLTGDPQKLSSMGQKDYYREKKI